MSATNHSGHFGSRLGLLFHPTRPTLSFPRGVGRVERGKSNHQLEACRRYEQPDLGVTSETPPRDGFSHRVFHLGVRRVFAPLGFFPALGFCPSGLFPSREGDSCTLPTLSETPTSHSHSKKRVACMLRVIAERYGMGGCGALELSRLHSRTRLKCLIEHPSRHATMDAMCRGS